MKMTENGAVRFDTDQKMRHSKQRDRIYDYLCSTKAHPSAETVYEDLRGQMPNLSLGTVYRNLKLLESLGKVRRVTTVQGIERYDADCSDHVHFICRGCGAIYDINGVDTACLMQTLPLTDGFDSVKLDLSITGDCPQCHS